MRILTTQYTLENKSLEIYVSGCLAIPKCSGCHNPESWDFNKGTLYDFSGICKKVTDFDQLIDNVMVMGGEPLDNEHSALASLLLDLRSLGKKIWLFTRYEFEDVPPEIKSLCDFVKVGAYKKELAVDYNVQFGVKLSTANQCIIALKNGDNMLNINKSDKGLFLDDGTEGLFVPDFAYDELRNAIGTLREYGTKVEVQYLTMTYVKLGMTLQDDVEGIFISMQDRDNILRVLSE